MREATLIFLALGLLAPEDRCQAVEPVSAQATHFEGQIGACGVPTSQLHGVPYVALNVQNTPGDYSPGLRRPVTGPKSGPYAGGYNCGRWVKITLGDDCVGYNDGAAGRPFCRDVGNGSWKADQFNGAELYAVVADSCQDNNAWCRDDPFHLDISTPALAQFKKNGQLVGNLLPNHFGNRKVVWEFVDPPSYQGDIEIGFARNSGDYYRAIVLANLPSGINGVEILNGDKWDSAKMEADNGQVYVLPLHQSSYTLRVIDAMGKRSKSYKIGYPSECDTRCFKDYTPARFE